MKAIALGLPIDVYNFGKMKRDFTYIDDVIEGVVRVMSKPPQINLRSINSPDAVTSTATYKLYNIGNNSPVELITFIELIEKVLGKTAAKNLLPIQPGDVLCTYVDVDELIKDWDLNPPHL